MVVGFITCERAMLRSGFLGTLYFSARDVASGVELWKSDGTEAGTVQVKDMNPGTGHSYPAEIVSAGGLLLFRASDGVAGYELWRSDGTGPGTVMIRV